MIVSDPERGRCAAELLHRAFVTTGIHGHKETPENTLPPGVVRGSLEHVLFITLTVSIDYQREANALWRGARSTYEDVQTRYLFEPKALHERPWREVRRDMQRHALSKKHNIDCSIWRTVGITFLKKWGGDPRNFLAHCKWDAPTILEQLTAAKHMNNGKFVTDFPFLRGRKIGPLWVRMLRDTVGLQIRNLESVPIPVDVHVARATLSLGIVRGVYEGGLEGLYKEIRRAWRESVQGLKVEGREMIGLDVDEPLWHLSKYGCTDRDTAVGNCKHYTRCEAKQFCIRGGVMVGSAGAKVATSMDTTNRKDC